MSVEVILLGSTGSIGTQALEVIAAEQLGVAGLAAGGANIALLADQVRRFRPPVVAVARAGAARELREALDGAAAPEILEGPDAASQLAGSARPGWRVLNGMTGAVGLEPTLAALRTGATLALANKESLVVGGDLVRHAQRRPGQVIPVDSEHSAVAQALRSGRHGRGMCAATVDGTSEVRRIILTASGGPFRGRSRDQLAAVTAAEALRHPTWSMGPVIRP